MWGKTLNTLIWAALLTSPIQAQNYLIVETKQRDSLKVTTKETELLVKTEFGELKIPFNKIRQISVGVHYTKEINDRIDQALRDLDNNDFKIRNGATKTLGELAQWAYHRLLGLPDNKNLEQNKRKEMALAAIKNNTTLADLAVPLYDLIETTNQVIKGTIANPSFKFTNVYLGEFTLFTKDLNTVVFRDEVEKAIILDSAAYSGKWFDTGVVFTKQSKLRITTEGQVDIFISQPGQYMVGPTGYTQNGKGWSFPAGALLGKIDENHPFVIGDSYNLNGVSGKLSIMIVPGPWDTGSTGTFTLKLKSH